MEYEAAVLRGERTRDHVKQPGSEQQSMVSTSGVLVAGKLKGTCGCLVSSTAQVHVC